MRRPAFEPDVRLELGYGLLSLAAGDAARLSDQIRALRRTTTIRVLTLGVTPEYRRAGIDMLLMHRVTTDGEAAGFRACEASWILEDNRDMLGPLETMGFRAYRRYRIYQKNLH